MVLSEYVYTIDYIEDQDIVDHLRAYWTSIDEVTHVAPQIKFRSNILYVEPTTLNVQTINIYSLDGKIVEKVQLNNSVSCGNLSKGIYIATCQLTSGKILTSKIIIK